ncbi:MAG: ATP-binding protein, partial [Synechococcales bacterium]|nr:ATP-binding protein [Synechococcales bacterium]
VRDGAGHPKAVLTVNTDITEQKSWEAQFYHAQRLESLGTLASGIAHDLNNVLTPVLAITQLLRRTQVPPERQVQMLEMLEDSVKRGSSLVQQILTFARGTPGQQIPMQITDLLREVVKVIQQTFPKTITIHPEIPPRGIGLISGDATQLHQVFMNLCVNARDAMPNRGELRISVQNCVVDERFTQLSLDAHPGEYVMVAITDTGMGIAPEVLDRIFDPFFTTKAVGQGTGLGLSTVLGIVGSHRGFVHVSSNLGQGTQFRIYLPITQAMVSDQPSVEIPLQGNGELILIVDDDLAVQGTNRAVLESYHYQTLVASDGIEAISLYAQRRQDIKVILLDVMMPNMDGISAIRTIRRIDPEAKIIAMSGLSSNQAAVEAVGAAVFLAKPCTVEDLLRTVYGLLHNR